MNFGQAAFAETWGDEGVTIGLLRTQAYFAPDLIAVFIVLLGGAFSFEDTIFVVEMVGVSDGECFGSVLHFDDHVLYSSHFNDISWF